MSNDSSYPTIIKYTVKISDSVMDALHGMEREITEIYIPQHKLCANVATGTLSIFESDEPREPITKEELSVTDSFIRLMKECYESRKMAEWFWDNEVYDSSPTTNKDD